MSIVDLIKRTALAAIDASNPVQIFYGTISERNPIEVEIHQKLKLTKEFLVMTQTSYDRDLKVGEKVILLRVQGGNQFLILDKVVQL